MGRKLCTNKAPEVNEQTNQVETNKTKIKEAREMKRKHEN